VTIDDNLIDGFSSGVNFILLVELITGKAITQKYFRQPQLDIHRIENVAIGIANLKKARKDFSIDVEPKSVAMGNVKTVLGLVWQMILRFQLMQEGEFAGSKNPMADAKARVLKWWRDMVGDVVDVGDSLDCFDDGRAYCAAINKIMKLSEPFESWSVRQRLERGMELAEHHLGVLPLLDVNDILADDPAQRPDERCVLTYVSEWPAAHKLKLANKSAQSEMDDALAKLKAEHEAAARAAALEEQRLRAELARESQIFHTAVDQLNEEAEQREREIKRKGEEALAAARREAARRRAEEEAKLSDKQRAMERDAAEALARAERERRNLSAEAQRALREEQERTARDLERAEAEKKAMEELKEAELQRLRQALANRLRRQELEREQADKEAEMRAKLSKDAFLDWRKAREDELARLRSDRLALEQLAREELARLREENERLKRGNPHNFVKKKFAGPTWCHLCKSLCWPTAFQCTRCKYTIDAKCMRRKPPANCVASEDDEEDDQESLGPQQIAALEDLPTQLAADGVGWRPTSLRADSTPEDDINDFSHGAWDSRAVVLKAGWLLLYSEGKTGKLKAVVNLARAVAQPFVASNAKEQARESMSLIVRGKKLAHALTFDDDEQRATWWRVLREQCASTQGKSRDEAVKMSIGDKVLVRLWRDDGGAVTLSIAADAAPQEVLELYAKKARIASFSNLGIYERRAPKEGQKNVESVREVDRLLGDGEPLHFLQGLRENAGKPIIFVVKQK
jgi:hypothetical protein